MADPTGEVTANDGDGANNTHKVQQQQQEQRLDQLESGAQEMKAVVASLIRVVKDLKTEGYQQTQHIVLLEHRLAQTEKNDTNRVLVDELREQLFIERSMRQRLEEQLSRERDDRRSLFKLEARTPESSSVVINDMWLLCFSGWLTFLGVSNEAVDIAFYGRPRKTSTHIWRSALINSILINSVRAG